jgi:serine/threonine protein kinase
LGPKNSLDKNQATESGLMIFIEKPWLLEKNHQSAFGCLIFIENVHYSREFSRTPLCTSNNSSAILICIRYVAPEVHNNRAFGAKADIWSLGIIFALMASGSPTVSDSFLCSEKYGYPETWVIKNPNNFYQVLKSNLSPQWGGYVSNLLQSDPSDRPLIATVIAGLYPFIDNMIV